MTIVADASVLVAALTSDDDIGAWARSMIESDDLAAPELIYVEVVNVLRRLEASGTVSTDGARAAAQDLCDLPIRPFGYLPFADRIWQLRQNVSAYDAWYVAVAEGLDSSLATLDARLSGAAGPTCEFVLPMN